MFIFNEILFHLKWEKARNKWIKNKKTERFILCTFLYYCLEDFQKILPRDFFHILWNIIRYYYIMYSFCIFFPNMKWVKSRKIIFFVFSHFVMVTRGKSRKNEKFCNNSQFSDNWKVPTGLKSFWFIRKMVFWLFLCS